LNNPIEKSTKISEGFRIVPEQSFFCDLLDTSQLKPPKIPLQRLGPEAGNLRVSAVYKRETPLNMPRKQYRNILLYKRNNRLETAPSMLIYDESSVERIGKIVIEEGRDSPFGELPEKITFKIDQKNPKVQAFSTSAWTEMLLCAKYRGQVPVKWTTLSQPKTKNPKRAKHI